MSSGIFSTWQSMLTEDAPYYVPFVVMVLIGFLAHKIFNSELYGHIADVIVALVGGYACMFAVELTLKQMYPERSGSDAQLVLELTVLCAVGAALLLYLARLLLVKKQNSNVW